MELNVSKEVTNKCKKSQLLVKKKWINLSVWETAHLPHPQANINTYCSLRAKCWAREGVGGQFPRNLIDQEKYLPCIISDAEHSEKTFSKNTIVIHFCLLQISICAFFVCLCFLLTLYLGSYFYVSLNAVAVPTFLSSINFFGTASFKVGYFLPHSTVCSLS